MQHYQECIALGSMTGLSIVGESSRVDKLFRELWRTIFLFERRFSRFLPGSELSIFNRNAGTRQAITPEFRDILIAARDLSHETDGLYNPFVLPALQAAGYSHSRVPGHEQDVIDDHSNRQVAAIDNLEIGDTWAGIPRNAALDLGGCGKGYLADQLRNQLPDDVTGYWFSLGGDIAVGGHDEHDQPWSISVQDANDPTKNIASLTATDACGIATSGTTIHRGKKDGKPWHHIIDPRTQQPAKTDVLTVTVCDSSSLRADVLASCAVILGSNQGLQFLKERGARTAMLQCKTEKAGDSRVMHFGNFMFGAAHA